MTVYSYSRVLVWDNLGGSVKVARNQRVDVTDPATGLVVAGLTQKGQPVSFVTSDSDGHVTFTSTMGVVRLTSARGFWQDVESPDLRTGAVTASADAATAAASAAAAATSARNAANLVGTPAGAAIDAYVGGNSSVLASRGGVILPATVSHTDVQAAIDSALTFGARAQVGGTYTTSQTLVIKGDVDLSNLVINYSGTGVAVQVGDTTVRPWKRLLLPRVVCTSKPATGWTAGSVGVKVVNIQSCANLTIPHVKGFETGVLLLGQDAGNVYNTVFLGHLENNKRNLSLDTLGTGWTNQNTIIGGRFSHSPTEGQPSAGTAHVWSGDGSNGANNNTFLGSSLETPGVVEYMVDLGPSAYNQFINCRWEATSGTANVRWRSGANLNTIRGGYNVGGIVETRVAGSTRNIIESSTRSRMFTGAGAGVVVENTSSSGSPIWTLMASGADAALADPATAWAAQLSASSFKFKAVGDTFERCRIDTATGRIYFGTGASAPVAFVDGTSATVRINGGHFIFDTDNTRDVGLSGANRPRDVFVGRKIVIGAAAQELAGTGSPEGVVTAPVGSTYRRTDGSVGAVFYVKQSGTGSTGWTPVSVPLFARKVTDQTANNTATLAADADLAVTVAAGGVYQVECLIHYSASTTADLNLGWTAPAGSSMDWTADGLATNTTSAGGSISRSRQILSGALPVGGAGASVGSRCVAKPAGLFTAGADGSLTLTWAQAAADASDTVVYAGSFLRLTRMA